MDWVLMGVIYTVGWTALFCVGMGIAWRRNRRQAKADAAMKNYLRDYIEVQQEHLVRLEDERND